jgi:hypothetical protein
MTAHKTAHTTAHRIGTPWFRGVRDVSAGRGGPFLALATRRRREGLVAVPRKP